MPGQCDGGRPAVEEGRDRPRRVGPLKREWRLKQEGGGIEAVTRRDGRVVGVVLRREPRS